MINTEVAYIMTTLGDLELASGGKTLQMFTPKNTPLGLLKVHGVDIKKLPTFSDYLQSGYQISLIGAIDFTFYANTTQTRNTHSTGLAASLNSWALTK